VKFIKNKFEDFTKQRNLALKEAKNDWLFLDADERLTTELKKEIIETINSENAQDAYYFYRIFRLFMIKISDCLENQKRLIFRRKSS
jgi:hypothetical protein